MEWFFVIWLLLATDKVDRREVTAATWSACEAKRQAFKAEPQKPEVEGRIWTQCTARPAYTVERPPPPQRR